MNTTKLVTAALLLALLAGPAYPQNKDILQLQRDMITLQQQMKQLQATLDSNDAVLKSLVEKVADQVNTLPATLQKITQAVDSVRNQNDAAARDLRGNLNTLNTAVGELQKDVSTLRGRIDSLSKQVTNMQTTAAPLPGPDDLWRTAFVDSASGLYDLAVSGFQEFLTKFPNDPRAAEAHLSIGDAYYSQKKYDQAVFEYDIVLQKFPDSDKTRSALYKKGLAQAEQNQPQQAIATLQ
ncbi:MAG: tetratricopeptide repeat protein, partial [Acidobacteria bacterium]|nr:tetratricopeptide repeat protein [Acidobacteriota bacterium]